MHKGPFQQYTGICLACGQNCYTTSECTTDSLVETLKKKTIKRGVGHPFEIEEDPIDVPQGPLDDIVGEYVNDPPYWEMRLRMVLTGTASPSSAEWVAALKRLLDRLEP